MKKVKDLLKTSTAFLTGAIGHYYVGKILELKEIKEQEILELKNQDFQENSTKTLESVNSNLKQISEALKDPQIAQDLKEKCITRVDVLKNSVLETIKANTQFKNHLNNNSSMDLIKESHIEFSKKLYDTAEEIRKLQDFIDNYKPNFNSVLTDLYSYLDTLQLHEISALFHILLLLVILLCAMDLVLTFFVNELISYLNLENKYPRLAKFIQLRRKFQRYYILFNLSLIILFSISAIIINIIVIL